MINNLISYETFMVINLIVDSYPSSRFGLWWASWAILLSKLFRKPAAAVCRNLFPTINPGESTVISGDGVLSSLNALSIIQMLDLMARYSKMPCGGS